MNARDKILAALSERPKTFQELTSEIVPHLGHVSAKRMVLRGLRDVEAYLELNPPMRRLVRKRLGPGNGGRILYFIEEMRVRREHKHGAETIPQGEGHASEERA